MMRLIYWLLFAAVLCSELGIIWALLFCNDKKLAKKYELTREQSACSMKYEYVLMIPVFDEVKGINASYKHFSEIAKNNVHCVYITTEKEVARYGTCKTKDCLELLMKKEPNTNVHVFHYPKTTGNKVDQLNYFISSNAERLKNPTVFLLDYDCDSRPELHTIHDIDQILKKYPSANVLQQNSRFWSVNKKSVILNLEAMYQTRWSFGFERINQYRSTVKWMNKLFVPFAYCVGHGMCIRAEYLLGKIGFFPQPLEDVPLGMMLTLLKEPIYPCISKDLAEIVPTTKALLKQAGHWLRSPLQAIPMYNRAKGIERISPYRTALYYIRMALDVLSWVQYLALLFVSVLLVAYNPMYIVGYMAFLYATSLLSMILLNKYKKNGEWRVTLLFVVLLPLRHFIRGMSIFSFAYQKIFGWFYDKGKNQ